MFTTKKNIGLIVLLILALLSILGTNYISEKVKSPSISIHLINIAKVAIPLKNLILMRNVDDQIALLKSSGSCAFCDLTQGDFKGRNLKDADLRYAILAGANLSNATLVGANLSNTNLSNATLVGANLSNANSSEVDLSNSDLTGTILTYAHLAGAYMDGVVLSNSDLTGANLDGVDLRNLDLTGTILTNADLTRANLSRVNFQNVNLTGTKLNKSNLSFANLTGVDLRDKDLTGTNLTGVDLSNMDLTGTILTDFEPSSPLKLYGGDLNNPSLLTGKILSEIDLSDKDLTKTIFKDSNKMVISVKIPSDSIWPAVNEIQNMNISRYDLSGDVQYLATKEGLLFESKNSTSRLVLDLNNYSLFPFLSEAEVGLLGIASKDKVVYVSYATRNPDGLLSLVVDEYSINFTKVRNIIKIDGFTNTNHFAGGLVFDQNGQLYLSVGDGNNLAEFSSQNLNHYFGKILRLDISKLRLEPEIIVYGARNPWGVTIDSKNRMFISFCGNNEVVAVYLLNDLYSDSPANLGWPLFEGSLRVRDDLDIDGFKEPLIFKDVLSPIFESRKRPGCLTSGVYLNDMELFLSGDFYGTIRLLKEQKNGEWNLFHEFKLEEDNIWSFGLDKKTKKIFIAPNNLELEILVDQVKLSQ